jgi:hypothetical protein
MSYWSDDKSVELIERLVKKDSSAVVYNLVEDVKCLKEQLAKANERIEKYKNAIDEECILWDFAVDEENPRKSIKQLLDITDAVARDPDVNNTARKFAIEQKIKAIDEAIAQSPSKLNYALPLIEITDLYEYQEQLRKEQK